MVFASIHPSLKPLLFSTQGPNLLNPWLNPLHQFQLPVHPSPFNHLSRIWVFILILECPSIRSSLTTEACYSKTIAAAIVGSRLDYCNSLLAGTSVSNLARLQLVQNTLAWVVTEKSRFLQHHTSSLLVALASYSPQNKFQDCYYHFQVLQFQQPSYLATLIPRHVPTRSLGSSSSLSLCVQTRKTGMAKSKSFSSVASSVWNKLPCRSSFIHFHSSCFQEETQAPSFSKCLSR